MVETSLCGRVGCGEVASCVLLMAPQDTEAWLVALTHAAAPEGVALCDAHADRISVPFGWALNDDRAVAKPRRKRAKKSTAPPKAAPSSGPKAKPEVVAATEPAPDPPQPQPVPEAQPEPAEALRVVPRDDSDESFDFEEDGQGALWGGRSEPEPDETTPLLKRAFRVVRDD